MNAPATDAATAGGGALAAAIAGGVAFLAGAQLPSGELPVLASTDPSLGAGAVPDPAIFPTAVIAASLAGCAPAAAVRERALDFLLAEMDRHGLWRHWPREHPQHDQLPPDLDDTSCASVALARAGRAFPDNRPVLLANRDRNGLYLTWIIPRLGWRGPAHARVALPQLRHLPTLFLFFRRTSAAAADVDAVVNANLLHYLGPRAETVKVIDHLVEVLRDGRERQCDKWYDNPFAIWYFFSRALGGISSAANAIIAERVAAAQPANALEAALAACALLNVGQRPSGDRLAVLLAAQLPSGAWPRAALYHGGRPRRRDGGFTAPHPDTPRWGSESLTTAFCIEALARLAPAAAP